MKRSVSPNLTNYIGRYSPLSQNLWRAGAGFRDNLNLLLTQKSVKLVVDEHVNFLRCLTPFFLSPGWLTTSHQLRRYFWFWSLGSVVLYWLSNHWERRGPVHGMCSNDFFPFVLMFRQSEYTFRIPNGEVTSEWHGWVKKYLVANSHIPL